MTSNQMKKGLNAEIKSAGFSNTIKEVSEVGVNTCLNFNFHVSPELKQWLNKRFIHGIYHIDTMQSFVVIKTPNQK
jgi:hypothetical protein